MGWAYGTTPDGREVGYGVEAVCEADGCETRIDRGLAYACGGWHEPTEHSCGHHFCAAHLFIVDLDELGLELTVGQLCPTCFDRGVRPRRRSPVARIDAAIFPGRCLACNGPIRDGDTIVLTIDGPPWTHQECQ